MKNQQLEILLKAPTARRTRTFRQRRMARAGWWFQQMRQVVDQAIEWKPSVTRPEQTQLLLAKGQ
jgi:hypothetical protein